MATAPTVYLYNENGHRIRVNIDHAEHHKSNGWSGPFDGVNRFTETKLSICDETSPESQVRRQSQWC